MQTITGWSYLSVVIDFFNNEIIDWRLSKINDLELVFNNVKNAIEKRNIKTENKLIIHSDHGSQYTSTSFQEMIKRNGIIQLMSRLGNSLDNRPIEYLFSIFKQEYLNTKPLLTFENMKNKMKETEIDYNKIRFQGGLKNMTPHKHAMSY